MVNFSKRSILEPDEYEPDNSLNDSHYTKFHSELPQKYVKIQIKSPSVKYNYSFDRNDIKTKEQTPGPGAYIKMDRYITEGLRNKSVSLRHCDYKRFNYYTNKIREYRYSVRLFSSSCTYPARISTIRAFFPPLATITSASFI